MPFGPATRAVVMRGMACLTVQNGMFHVKQSCGSESVAGHIVVWIVLDKGYINMQLIMCQDVMLNDKMRPAMGIVEDCLWQAAF